MAEFESTQWSVVLAARDHPTVRSREALASLCNTYWKPLYFFVRRKGYPVEEAQDLTQEFFARFIEHGYIQSVDQERGKFRSFLRASMSHFLANEWNRARTQKRGGGAAHFSLDFTTVNDESPLEVADTLTPERIYERQCALALLGDTLKALEGEYRADNKAELFQALKFQLATGPDAAPYSEIAVRLGMSEAAVKTAAHRLRNRYRDTLKRKVAQTVENKADVASELRDLFQALT